MNEAAGLQVYWASDLLGFRSTGLQVYWASGLLGFRIDANILRAVHPTNALGTNPWSISNIRLPIPGTMIARPRANPFNACLATSFEDILPVRMSIASIPADGKNEVLVAPGARRLTATPEPCNSHRRPSANRWMKPLVAEYAQSPGPPAHPARDPTNNNDPLLRSSIPGRIARVSKITASQLSLIIETRRSSSS